MMSMSSTTAMTPMIIVSSMIICRVFIEQELIMPHRLIMPTTSTVGSCCIFTSFNTCDERSDKGIGNVGKEHLVDDESDREDDDSRQMSCHKSEEQRAL